MSPMLAPFGSFEKPVQQLFSLANDTDSGIPEIKTMLGPQLSSNASIFLPGSAQFIGAALKWQVDGEALNALRSCSQTPPGEISTKTQARTLLYSKLAIL